MTIKLMLTPQKSSLLLFAMAATQATEDSDQDQDAGQPPDSARSEWSPVNDLNSDLKSDKTKNEQSLDRLLSEDLIIIQDDHHISKSELKKSPLDFIKYHHHNYLHNNHHHHNHHHHNHHHHDNHHQKPDRERAQGEERERIRRHYDGYLETSGAADRPVVATRKGLVRGMTQKIFTGKFVDVFLGIPYAQPPIGRYRFRHPQSTNPWPGELDASRQSNSCYQVNDTFFGANFLGTSIWNANTPLNEDCLYLNIWTPFGIANTTVPTPSKVYRPLKQNNNSSVKRPVLVWIFGGGFYSGSSSLAVYDGGVLASEEDIIVVSMNYRVSALGFLYFGRPDSPGNAGLFDQLMALQWINDNIDQFGGDPNRVTIFGESAGAVSVAFHLLSPLSRNLFSQAILQSGAATCPWGFMEPREIIANGLQLASLLNCPSNGSDLDAVVECLLKADPMALVSQEVGQIKTILNFPFVPVVDGSFLIESPVESLIKSNFKRARILLGSNYDEGNAFLIYLPEFSQCPGASGNSVSEFTKASHPEPEDLLQHPQQQEQQYQQQQQQPSDLMAGELRIQGNSAHIIESFDLLATTHGGLQYPSSLGHQASSQQASNAEAAAQHNLNLNDSKPCKPNEFPSLTREDFLRVLKDDLNPYAEHPVGKEAIVFEYSNWNNPQDSVSNYDAIDKIVGDYYFTCHVNEFAQRYANDGNSVFMYYFKQRPSMSPWPKWMGVLHADEINFVFGEPLNQQFNYTAKEVELSRRMMKYWANFAKYGNPTKLGENLSMPEKWPEYSDKRQYFELHGDFVRIGRGPRAKQCAFWSHYLPKLIETFDRGLCPASDTTQTHPRHPHIHTLDTSYADQNSQRQGIQFNVLSPIVVSLSVILVLTIICILYYAKRTGKLAVSSFCPSNGNSD